VCHFWFSKPKMLSRKSVKLWGSAGENGLSVSQSICCSVCSRSVHVVYWTWPSSWSCCASSSWWLSIRSSFITTSSGFLALRASRQLPAPAWLMIKSARWMSSAMLSLNRKYSTSILQISPDGGTNSPWPICIVSVL